MRANDEGHSYTFAGWDKDFSNIVENITVTALYKAIANKYTVEFVDHNGKILSTQTVEYGKSATAPEDPERPEDVNYKYTFTGWDKSFSKITADTTITAVYEATEQVYYVFGDFNNWEAENVMSKGENGVYTVIITLDAGTYSYNAANLDETKVWPSGSTQSITLDEQCYVTFVLNTAESTLTATAEPVIKRYTVTFEDYDGTVLSTQTVKEGEAAVAPAEPQRDADGQYAYIFAGWDADFSVITSDTVVTAQYRAQLIEFEVKFVDFDGSELSTQTIAYGEAAIAPSDPERAADAQYTYIFAGWDKAFDNITSDLTVTAKYVKTVNTYTVLFVGLNNQLIDLQTVKYGNEAKAPEAPVVDGYTFTIDDSRTEKYRHYYQGLSGKRYGRENQCGLAFRLYCNGYFCFP